MTHVSPFAPSVPTELHPVAGVRLGALPGDPTLALVEMPQGTTVAGVFTRSLTSAAAVDWCKSILPFRHARGLLIHIGNANAFTGMRGLRAQEKAAAAVAGKIGCSPTCIYVAGSGEVAQPLSETETVERIAPLYESLSETAWEAVARAIMPPGTYVKRASRIARLGNLPITLTGIATGACAQTPDKAGILCFLFTDVKLNGPLLQDILDRVHLRTFANISLDGDASSNDAMMMFATGQTEIPLPLTSSMDPLLRDFEMKLTDVAQDLALQIVKDGEGVRKFITITVRGARSDVEADKIARAIAESPAVKTALGEARPCWSRLVSVIGRTGCGMDRDKLEIWFEPHLMLRNGEPNVTLSPEAVQETLQQAEITVTVDVGVGNCSATLWTSDLGASASHFA